MHFLSFRLTVPNLHLLINLHDVNLQKFSDLQHCLSFRLTVPNLLINLHDVNLQKFSDLQNITSEFV